MDMSGVIKKVLLIFPPVFNDYKKAQMNPVPPLGLAYIAAVLEREGFVAEILDCYIEGLENEVEHNEMWLRIGLEAAEVKARIESSNPDLIGICSNFTVQRENTHYVAQLAKEILPDVPIVVGGAHASVCSELILEDPNVDYTVLGEGELPIINLINHINNEESKDLSHIRAIGFRTEEGDISINTDLDLIDDVDSIPFPARHLLPMEKYRVPSAAHGERKTNRYAPIITSRGCPFKCTFCSASETFGKPNRRRSIENVILEMRMLKEEYQIEEIMFEDDNLVINPKHSIALFERMIEEKFDFIWDTPNGILVTAISDDLAKSMKDSGCFKINLSIESGDEYVLKYLIKKPLHLSKARETIEILNRQEIPWGANFVLGTPGETFEQMSNTFRFMREQKIFNPYISISTPYPGTPTLELCREKGYIEGPLDLDKLFITTGIIDTEDWKGEDMVKFVEWEKFKLSVVYRALDEPDFAMYIAKKVLGAPITSLNKIKSQLANHPIWPKISIKSSQKNGKAASH